jgi:hypothetical protein
MKKYSEGPVYRQPAEDAHHVAAVQPDMTDHLLLLSKGSNDNNQRRPQVAPFGRENEITFGHDAMVQQNGGSRQQHYQVPSQAPQAAPQILPQNINNVVPSNHQQDPVLRQLMELKGRFAQMQQNIKVLEDHIKKKESNFENKLASAYLPNQRVQGKSPSPLGRSFLEVIKDDSVKKVLVRMYDATCTDKLDGRGFSGIVERAGNAHNRLSNHFNGQTYDLQYLNHLVHILHQQVDTKDPMTLLPFISMLIALGIN